MPTDTPASKPVHRIAGWALARYMRRIVSRAQVITDPADHGAFMQANHPFILAMWHGQFMLLPALNVARIPLSIMVAKHGDAEVLGEALKRFDMGLIRGAGAGDRKRDRGGANALRVAITALEQGLSVAMTADVPPGPARLCGLGIVTLARITGRPVLPVAVASSRFRVLETWSRFTMALPSDTVGLAFGTPILVPRRASPAELEAMRRQIEEAMNRTTERAYALAGADIARTLPSHMLPPPAPGVAVKAYRGLTTLLRPAAPAILSHRERRGKEDGARRNERYGMASIARPKGRLAWLHAASVGETNAVLPLIEAAKKRWPDLNVLLTTGTVTSAALARARLADVAVHQYVPLDSPGFVSRFLDHWRPQLAVFVESELWPNLVLESDRRGIPMMLINARMSKRSFARWRRRSRFAATLFGRFRRVLTQDEVFARRFMQLGAHGVVAAGNLKFDAPPPPVDVAEVARLRAVIGARPVMLAASTHPGEDEIVAAAHRLLHNEGIAPLTVIVPRHPERGPTIAGMLSAMGLRAARRAAGETPSNGESVYLADTIGELGTFFALAPAAFMGGSLVPHGGQNPIEAVKLGCGVLTGPHWQNFEEAYGALLKQRACIEVHSAAEIATAFRELQREPAHLQAMCTRAEQTVAGLGGALARTLEAIAALLEQPSEVVHSAA